MDNRMGKEKYVLTISHVCQVLNLVLYASNQRIGFFHCCDSDSNSACLNYVGNMRS